MRWRRAVGIASIALFAFLALTIATACGDDDDDSPPSPTPTTARPRPSETTTLRPSPSLSPTPSPAAEPLPDPPVRDLLDLARRYRGYPYDAPGLPRTAPLDHQVGDSVVFTLLDLNTVELYQVTASVVRITDHAYFFVQDGSSYSGSALDTVTSDFESLIWPTVTGAFGEPLTPGADGDSRITILHADLRGAGGYVTSSDGYPRAAVPRSNEREMVYVDRSVLGVPGTRYNSLVGHELQHLVHHAQDANEESWINEGMSEVAGQMVGAGTDNVWEFLGAPDTQLTVWPYVSGTSIHYAASELYLAYLLDHYGGRENGHQLSLQPADGPEGVDDFLRPHGKAFDDTFADFVAANLLDLPDGPYGHPNFNGRTETVSNVGSGETGDDTVAQFGTDYYRPTVGSTFRFDGAEETNIGIPPIGGPFWWSGRGDGINPRFTRTLDLTGVDAATLRFDAWYDIEPGWDYAYVSVSADGGRTWRALPGRQTTGYNPLNTAYGPGYTRSSGGWVAEEIDLSEFAGSEVLLRFEYVTDDAAHLTGFAVDNISVPQLGFTDGADTSEGWEQEGFRRIDGPLAQAFIVQLIGDDGVVERVILDAGNAAAIAVNRPATIAISGATRNTTEPGPYTWSLD